MRALEMANRDPDQARPAEAGPEGGQGQDRRAAARPAEWLDSAKVFDIILAVPKYGRVKVNRILNQCRISPSKTIGGLSERQRAELVALLRRR